MDVLLAFGYWPSTLLLKVLSSDGETPLTHTLLVDVIIEFVLHCRRWLLLQAGAADFNLLDLKDPSKSTPAE